MRTFRVAFLPQSMFYIFPSGPGLLENRKIQVYFHFTITLIAGLQSPKGLKRFEAATQDDNVSLVCYGYRNSVTKKK